MGTHYEKNIIIIKGEFKMEVKVIKATTNIMDRAKAINVEVLRVAAYCRVSTEHKEQLESFESQKKHYSDLINENKEWVLAGIYADKAITGTGVAKREQFTELINDCMDGSIDMVLTKSISRFSRNTVDTLKYIRMLKDKGIAVVFEQENINTLTAEGELMLTILAAIAQQYVENLSDSVKFGLQAKMKRGEMVGFHGALGYNYDKEKKSIYVNITEADVVKYIFSRYIEGAGGMIISRELENLGHKTKRGNVHWNESAVIGIVKNEKYIGALVQGSSFTVDSISKRRLANRGEADQFYLEGHHEAIIDKETFEKAQVILRKRNENRTKLDEHGRREKFSHKYTFSCMLKCGFCNSNLSRRNWHSGTPNQKRIWQCVVATKKGKKNCPSSKGIEETIIEEAFVQSYQLMCGDNREVLSEFLSRMETSLQDNNSEKQLNKVEKSISALEAKNKKLLENLLDETITKSDYIEKKSELEADLKDLCEKRQVLQNSTTDEKQVRLRLEGFKRALESNETLTTFDTNVFESIVDRVIIGSRDEDGTANPHSITFVYKTGLQDSIEGKKACSYTSSETCGIHNPVAKRKTLK
jgi:DNA invertase Pin-like site-specific DNA recombinase